MISFNFDIAHPFNSKFKHIWSRTWCTPFKNKFVELEIHTIEHLIGFNFLWTINRDHAGIDIQLSLVGYCVCFNFYDRRHWNSEVNCYEQTS